VKNSTVIKATAKSLKEWSTIIGLGHFIELPLGEFLTDQEKDILAGIGSGSKLVELIHHLGRNSPTTWREFQHSK
jgi:hypothetical protein